MEATASAWHRSSASRGGSPFFINELIQYSGRAATRCQAAVDAADHQSSPVGLDAVIRAPVRRLADEPRRLLHTLAIFGGPLSFRWRSRRQDCAKADCTPCCCCVRRT